MAVADSAGHTLRGPGPDAVWTDFAMDGYPEYLGEYLGVIGGSASWMEFLEWRCN